MAPNDITRQDEEGRTRLEAVMRRLGPSMARTIAETAGGFLAVEAAAASEGSVIPRLPEFGVLRCSQSNLGGKHAMILDMAVEKSEWQRLFTAGEDEDFRMDAFCEMANCICGSLTAETAFTGEFGYLMPEVPRAFPSRTPREARSYRGAFRLGGAWIRFAVTCHPCRSRHEADGIRALPAMMAA